MSTKIINNVYYPPYPDYDPLNPLRTVSDSRFSYDPVHPDALDIAERLMGSTTESELRRIVWEAFRDLFMDEIAGDRDSEYFREASFDFWRYYVK